MGRSEVSSAVIIPLLISGCGIVITGIAILTYQFVIVRFCVARETPRRGEVVDLEAITIRRGFEKAALDLIPIIERSSEDLIQSECAICLGDFNDEPQTLIRLLPNCRHAFHSECVDEWLSLHISCPVCRRKIFPFVFSDVVVDAMDREEQRQAQRKLILAHMDAFTPFPLRSSQPALASDISQPPTTTTTTTHDRDTNKISSSSSSSSSSNPEAVEV